MSFTIPPFDGSEQAGNLKASFNAIVSGINNAVTHLTGLINNVSANANMRAGTAAQRAAYTGTAPEGFIWQDTDGDKPTWRKQGSTWIKLLDSIDSGNVTSNVATAASGWAMVYQRYRHRGELADIAIRFRRTGGTINATSNGNIVNQVVAHAGTAIKKPRYNNSARLTGYGTGPSTMGYMNVSGDIALSAITPGRNILNGDEFELGGYYWVL